MGWEGERRARSHNDLHAEIKGEHEIPHRQARIHALAIADRIEQRADGSYAIIDYKTGQPPTEKQVRTGWRRN